MTVSELVELLKKHDGKMRVVLCGYDGGLHDVSGAETKQIKIDVNNSWYYGPHEEVYGNQTPDETALHIQ